MISIVQSSFGQKDVNGFLKQIITIEFYGNTSDTTIQNIEFDSNGNRLNESSNFISFLNPILIDTIKFSDNETKIVYTWQDNTTSVIEEFKTLKKHVKIRIDNNGRDTTYFSKYNINDEGFPRSGIIIIHGDTTKFESSDNISLFELMKIRSNIINESEFIDFSGIIQIPSKRKVLISELEEPRNTIEIYLNKKLQPKKIIKKEWHDYHKMIFKNKYSYKYKDGKLVKIKNVDMFGDLEMIRTIDYLIN